MRVCHSFSFTRHFSLLGLAGVLWLKWDTFTSQTYSFLDEVVSDAYTILQSERDAQWKDIETKKSSFYEIFDANDPVGQNDENPLSLATESLTAAEKVFSRIQNIAKSLDNLNMEYGVDASSGIPESKIWQTNPSTKLSPPASYMDPFADESKFPYKDIKRKTAQL